MRSPTRLALALAVAALLAFPAAAPAQSNVRASRLTHLFNSPRATVNSDLAFWGNFAVTGDYDGFRVFDITNPAAPILRSTVTCTTEAGQARAGQGDVSIWRNLVFRSVDTPQTSPDCGTRARTSTAAVGTPGFEGIDIFDISNPDAPAEVAHVATDCGSHTHTLVPDLRRNRVLLYVSSYPASYLSDEPTEWGNTCQRLQGDGSQGHDKISIVEVPLANPAGAHVLKEQPLGLTGDFQGAPGWKGCHDITVFLPLKIAAGACLTEGVLMDISNPANPVITTRLENPAIDQCARTTPSPPAAPLCLWHSATFTWDGKYVVFGDEAGGGGSPECAADDPPTRGAFWLYRLSDTSSAVSSYKIPRAQPDTGDPATNQNCTAHIMNFVPTNRGYFLPSSWYFGGTSVVNWTNVRSPFELAYYEVEPGAEGDEPYTDTWTSYWYNDYIYANDINRGLDVFSLNVPWRSQAWNLRRFNPQTQESLIRCRVTSHAGPLRARRRDEVHVVVRVLGGQAVSAATVRLRGAGVRVHKRTNATGEAMFMVRPTRRGTLRISVPAQPNMLGCATSRTVRAAPRAGTGGAGTGGAGLTGRQG